MSRSTNPLRRHHGTTLLTVTVVLAVFGVLWVGIAQTRAFQFRQAATATAATQATIAARIDATNTARTEATSAAQAAATATADAETTTVEEVMAGEGHVIQVAIFRDGSPWTTAAGTFCVETRTGPTPADPCDGFSNGGFTLFVGDTWVGRAYVTFTFDGQDRTFYSDERGGTFGWDAATIRVV